MTITTLSAPGADQLSSSRGVSTSLANASLVAREATEPETVPATCKTQAGGQGVSRRTLMNMLVSSSLVGSSVVAQVPTLAENSTDHRLIELVDLVTAAAEQERSAYERCSAVCTQYESLKPERPNALRWRMTDPVWISHEAEDLPNGKVRLWCSPLDIIRAKRATAPLVSHYEFIGAEADEIAIRDSDFDDTKRPYAPKPHIAHLYEPKVREADLERWNEIVAAYDEHDAACMALQARLNLDELCDQCDEASGKTYNLYREATEIQTSSLAGLQAKAAILIAHGWRGGIDQDELEVDDMVRSIVAGLIHRPTAPVRVVPASSGPETDPIFTAIEAHRSAHASYIEANRWHSMLDRELPFEKCQSSITAREEKIIETDDPRWIEAERELMRTSEAEDDAALLLIKEPPATISGAAALLTYIAEVEVDGCRITWPDGLQDDDGGGPKTGRDWAYYLHKNLAATFAGRVAA